jgi:E3 ubiquitin-protein ligase HECTD2
MFVYDNDSSYCYFNPNTLEKGDQFFLVGVVLGLAIHNLTILDVALPPFVFRRLLVSSTACTLEDLQEINPRVAQSLRHLLEYPDSVEDDFGLDFTVTTDHYGAVQTVPLCPDGESRPVTNANRREYVNLRVRYFLEQAVSKQFEPFKRGFLTVCAGSALSLFRPEEIELLVRGSDEPLDVAALQAVARYSGWDDYDRNTASNVLGWFWDSMNKASVQDQRKLLGFITGSDRIPAGGPSTLQISVVCLSDDRTRFPIARTCFNMLGLHLYDDREMFEHRLWMAVNESAGFGLK